MSRFDPEFLILKTTVWIASAVFVKIEEIECAKSGIFDCIYMKTKKIDKILKLHQFFEIAKIGL